MESKYVAFVGHYIGENTMVIDYGKVVAAASPEEAAERLALSWPMLVERETVTVYVLGIGDGIFSHTLFKTVKVERDARRCPLGGDHEWQPAGPGHDKCRCGAEMWQNERGTKVWWLAAPR